MILDMNGDADCRRDDYRAKHGVQRRADSSLPPISLAFLGLDREARSRGHRRGNGSPKTNATGLSKREMR
jgi:hypothetical protein